MSARPELLESELRRRLTRGALLTGGFVAAIDMLVIVQGLIVTRLLGPRSIGLYGAASSIAVALLALKRVGLDEAFVQQREADQEREFQCAFTLELALALALALAIAAISPLAALVYHDQRLLALTASLCYLPVAFALQAPVWVFFREMDYRRQRSLQAVQPLVTFAVMIPLVAATGVGVWGIVIGTAAGHLASVAIARRHSPYRLALRYDRAVAGRYLRFSAPILLSLLATGVIAQGQVLALKLYGGLAAAGFITLAATLTRYIDRADQALTGAIYPAICAIQGQRRSLQSSSVSQTGPP